MSSPSSHERIIAHIRELFRTTGPIALHEPLFVGNEKVYLNECIDTTFVSSVGKFVDRFESMVAQAGKARHAVAVVNGTEALHVALLMAGVSPGDEVITQPLTFIGTVNAITFCRARPVFVDVDRANLGLSAASLENFLNEHGEIRESGCFNRRTGARLAACVPVHIFGHPCEMDKLKVVCSRFRIPIVEDAAEAVGSLYKGRPCGGIGELGVFSFNGNKTITCGGGGAILTNNELSAKLAKHRTTTAKLPHRWSFFHDQVGFNFRLPNLNAALACAQLECLEMFVANKRQLALEYASQFESLNIKFVKEPPESQSNYWLNAIELEDRQERDEFLSRSNEQGVMTRPCWELMTTLPMYKDCQSAPLPNALWLSDRLVNIPSSVRRWLLPPTETGSRPRVR